MIGGCDITIPSPAGITGLDACLRVIRLKWPSAVFQDADHGELVDYGDLVVSPRTRDLFAYRDRESAVRWETLGADPSLRDTLIHLKPSPERLTVVVDAEPSKEMVSMVALIRDTMRMDILRTPAARMTKRDAA